MPTRVLTRFQTRFLIECFWIVGVNVFPDTFQDHSIPIILFHDFLLKRGGGHAALLRFGSAAPVRRTALGVQSPIP